MGNEIEITVVYRLSMSFIKLKRAIAFDLVS